MIINRAVKLLVKATEAERAPGLKCPCNVHTELSIFCIHKIQTWIPICLYP